MDFRKISIPKEASFVGNEAGPAPMLQWLKIEELVVDDAYQRPLARGNWSVIRRIAANFRWSRFSPVFVAPVEGGKYAIIDGQHRCHAAALCGHESVPCQIVQMDAREQAEAFAAVNGMVTKVTTWNIYKASLAAGADWARRCHDLAERAGCKVMTSNASHWSKKPGEIYGVKTFRNAVQGRNDADIVAALTFLRKAEAWGDDAAYWDSTLLIPVLGALIERPHVMLDPKFKQAFEALDIFKIVEDDKQERRERIRKGLSYAPKSETLRAAILEFIDKGFPQRMALPSFAIHPSRKAMLEAVGRMSP